jgi:hypothetical protein
MTMRRVGSRRKNKVAVLRKGGAQTTLRDASRGASRDTMENFKSACKRLTAMAKAE